MVKKKFSELPALGDTLIDIPAESVILELDELWSFVVKKVDKQWIWIALCRQTRQVVGYAIGDRSEETCTLLWESIPEKFKHGQCFSDFWTAYAQVSASEQLTQVGKDTGQTNHVERWNNTLRQRLGRFVRRSLSFSKSREMHTVCLTLFIHYYNLTRAADMGVVLWG
jgi:insertion element IS1 protein InsB